MIFISANKKHLKICFLKFAVLSIFFSTVLLTKLCKAEVLNIPTIGIDSQLESSYFYLKENSSNAWLPADIFLTSNVNNDNIKYMLVDKNISDYAECTMYTEWDEKITDILLSTNDINLINGVSIIPVEITLPIVYIDADISEFHTMDSDKYKNEKCMANISCNELGFNSPVEINGHGNLTWDSGIKHSYNLHFDKSINLSGFGKANDLVLISNTLDPSCLKNQICFDFAKKIDYKYVPNTEMVHLIVNNNYLGIYSLTNKIRKNNHILNINATDYLLCLGSPSPKNMYTFNSSSYFIESYEDYQQPYFELIYPKNPNTAQMNYIQSKVQELFYALDNGDEKQIKKLVDMESFAKLYWVEEISMNYDAPARSIYIIYVNGK